jgi:hypothetical protein
VVHHGVGSVCVAEEAPWRHHDELEVAAMEARASTDPMGTRGRRRGRRVRLRLPLPRRPRNRAPSISTQSHGMSRYPIPLSKFSSFLFPNSNKYVASFFTSRTSTNPSRYLRARRRTLTPARPSSSRSFHASPSYTGSTT